MMLRMGYDKVNFINAKKVKQKNLFYKKFNISRKITFT